MAAPTQSEISFDKNKILLLCKVVDNFGDIGVVYRLAKRLSDIRPGLELTLVVSNLKSFSAMAKEIDPELPVQIFTYKNTQWRILDWNLPSDKIKKTDSQIFFDDVPIFPKEMSVILECFQCGRPEWLEDLLFSKDFVRPVQILNVDYLTAEEYADDFHLLRSGTRSANVKKRFFMPGFTPKTGGLILDEEITSENTEGRSLSLAPKPDLPSCPLPSLRGNSPQRPSYAISFFSYERNCTPIVQAISEFESEMRKKNPDFSVCVYLAAGKSYAPFMQAYKELGEPFCVQALPFLQQEEWDSLLKCMDFNFVRGEDSLSRAALSGIPYIWHAYIQDEDYQIVKVNALLERMKPYFEPTEFETLKNYWNSYNVSTAENFMAKADALVIGTARSVVSAQAQSEAETMEAEDGTVESTTACCGTQHAETPKDSLKKILFYSADETKTFRHGFENFSRMLKNNGDLAQHIIDFINKLEL